MKFCIHCGAPLKEGIKFCTSCGSAVALQQAEQPAPKEPVAPAPVQQPAPKTAKAPRKPTSLMKKHPARSAVCIVLAVVILMAVYLFYPRFPELKYEGETLRYGKVVSADYLAELFDKEVDTVLRYILADGVYIWYGWSDIYESCTIYSYSIGVDSEDTSIGGVHIGDSAGTVTKKYWNAKRTTDENGNKVIRVLLDRNGCPAIYSEKVWETSATHFRLIFQLDEDGCVEYISFY